ncbi:phosphate-selective porin O/P [Pontibacter ramchanderi]|uniref:Phosphate-selective porin O/P n=1 Tax=Pontibacter ramchanderi TaxID=1179743 RepID=A0A2N3U9U0_9BACT|nr:phosphate-selective porin O/P [Pontibacter ramchanderi]
MNKYYLSFAFVLLVVQSAFAPNTAVGQIYTDSTSTNKTPANQELGKSTLSSLSEKIDINFLFRSSLEFPSGSENQGAIRLNESRLELRGDLTPELSFRVRYRLNRGFAPNSLDNAPGAIDHANVTYRFGNEKKWHLTAGKQSASVGSWEFDKNPTFEYQYTEYVNRQLNLFLLAMKLGYDITENHTFQVQLHNTFNNDFNATFNGTGYAKDGLRPSKTPLGLYVAWLGNMFDRKWQTFYSYNVSQFARDKTNHGVSIGNQITLDRLSGYLDLQSANLAVDYPNIGSPAANALGASSPAFVPTFLQDVNYKTAVLRLDYEFIPKWFLTTKGYYETASHREDGGIGDNFRKNMGYWAGLEYKPIASQDMKLFTYYYYNTTRYNNAVAQANANQKMHLFAVGVLYFVNAL